MNDTLLLQQVYPAPPGIQAYNDMLELNVQRNRNYCIYHHMDYRNIEGVASQKYADEKQGGWAKIELILLALQEGYQNVIWLDPDTLVRDLTADLRDGCIDGIGACWHRIPQLNHWNVGALYFQNTPEVIEFCENWLAEFPGQPGWMEQGAFNKLALQGNIVQTISDRWNATLNYSMVPDAVVLGFHGNGTPQQRLEMMKKTLNSLENAESGAKGQREVIK